MRKLWGIQAYLTWTGCLVSFAEHKYFTCLVKFIFVCCCISSCPNCDLVWKYADWVLEQDEVLGVQVGLCTVYVVT